MTMASQPEGSSRQKRPASSHSLEIFTGWAFGEENLSNQGIGATDCCKCVAAGRVLGK